MPLADVIAFLELARPVMKTIPGIGGQLEGGVETIKNICDYVEVSCVTQMLHLCGLM
jgi:hypothetical protein